MKHLKHATAAAMAAALAITSLTGCGSNNEPAAGQPSSQESASQSQPADTSTPADTEDSGDEEIGTITVMGVDWGYGPKQNSTMEQYWEEYFGVEFEIDWVSYKDYAEKLNTLLASGKPEDVPDVVQIMSTNNGGFYYPSFAQAVDAGLFVNMDSYLFEEGLVAGNPVMKEWPEEMWKNTKYKGCTYILPRSKSEVAPNSGINVRRDLMKEHGFEEEPATMDELKDWLIGLAKASGLYALDFSTDDFNDVRVAAFATAFTGQGLWGLDANGDYVYQPFAGGYLDFMNWMKDMYDEGVIDPEFIMKQTDVSSWKAGKSVAYLNAWYNWNQSEDKVVNKLFDKNTPDTYEAWCLMPVKGPKGYTLNLHAYGFGEAIAINANCSEAKIRKIMEVFNATGEEYDDIMLNGVEGLHYNIVDGARVADEDQKIAKQEGYVGGWNQIFLKANVDIVDQKFIQKKCSQESIDRAYQLKETTEKEVKEMNLTIPNNNLISETYNNSWSALIADCNDFIAQYIMGQIDEDTWKAYVDSVVNSPEYKAINEEYKAAAKDNA